MELASGLFFIVAVRYLLFFQHDVKHFQVSNDFSWRVFYSSILRTLLQRYKTYSLMNLIRFLLYILQKFVENCQSDAESNEGNHFSDRVNIGRTAVVHIIASITGADQTFFINGASLLGWRRDATTFIIAVWSCNVALVITLINWTDCHGCVDDSGTSWVHTTGASVTK